MIKRIVCVVALFVLAGCATRQDAPNSGSAASADGSSSSADSVVAEPSAVVSAALLAAEKMSSTEPSVILIMINMKFRKDIMTRLVPLVSILELTLTRC